MARNRPVFSVIRFAAVVAVTIGVLTLLEAGRKAPYTFELQAQMNGQQEHKARLLKEKTDLEKQIAEVSSPEWPELAAREQLGWTRADEVLVVLKPKPVVPMVETEAQSLPERVSSRWQEWVQFLSGARFGQSASAGLVP
jgi:cell division protein FtsB